MPDGIMALGMILLNERFAIFDDMGIQKVMPMVGLGLVVLDFGYILSIFRMKYHGYPYRYFAQTQASSSSIIVLFFFSQFPLQIDSAPLCVYVCVCACKCVRGRGT